MMACSIQKIWKSEFFLLICFLYNLRDLIFVVSQILGQFPFTQLTFPCSKLTIEILQKDKVLAVTVISHLA